LTDLVGWLFDTAHDCSKKASPNYHDRNASNQSETPIQDRHGVSSTCAFSRVVQVDG
jgi:hypothetical protein